MSIYKAHFFCVKLGGFWTPVSFAMVTLIMRVMLWMGENDHDEDDNADKQLGSKKIVWILVSTWYLSSFPYYF